MSDGNYGDAKRADFAYQDGKTQLMRGILNGDDTTQLEKNVVELRKRLDRYKPKS